MKKDILQYHDINNHHVKLVKTISENEVGYRKHHIKNFNLAREIYAKVRHPYYNYFNNLIRSNLIRNCPVTLEDDIRDEKIYHQICLHQREIPPTAIWIQLRQIISFIDAH